MVDFANLVLTADSRQMLRAGRDMDKMTASGGRAERQAGKLGAAMGTLAGKATVLGLSLAAAFGGRQAVQVISEYETAISQVAAVTRATTAELTAMREVSMQLGSTTEFTAAQAADGLRFLGMAGFEAAEAIAALPDVLDLATASGMGPAQSADIASNIMSAFSIEANKAASVGDILAAASSRANTDVSQLGEAMKFVGPVASSLDIAMSDAAAAIGKLSDAGIQGTMAGTGLRRILSSLANPTDQAAAALGRMGLRLEQLNPQTNSIVDIVERLSEAGLSAADALTIFGDRGGPAILALTSNVSGLRELTEELQNVDGEASRMADTMRDNLGGDIKGLGSAIQGLILSLGDAGLTAVLRTVVQGLTGVVRAISAIISATAGIATATARMMGFGNTSHQTQLAIDNVTMALGDEIRQLGVLSGQLVPGTRMTIQAAEAKLTEARAIREKITAANEEARQIARNSAEYRRAALEEAEMSRIISEIIQERTDTPEATWTYSDDDLQEFIGALESARAKQQQIIDEAAPLSEEFMQAEIIIGQLEIALLRAADGMVELEGEGAGVVTIGDRIANIFSTYPGILGDGADGASVLAQMLNGAAQAAGGLANALSAALGRLVALLGKLPGVGTGVTALGGLLNAATGSDAFQALKTLGGNIGANLQGIWQQGQAAIAAGWEPAGYGRTGGGGGGGGGGQSEAQKQRNDDLREAERIIESTRTAQERYNESLEQADRLLDAGVLPLEAYTRHVEQLREELKKESFGDFERGIDSVADAISGAIVQGESLRDNFRKILADMAQDILKSGIKRLISGMFSGGGVSSGGGGFFSSIFKIFGKRRVGGTAQEGMPYLVNEQTPQSEVFVPSRSGGILNVPQAQAALRDQAGGDTSGETIVRVELSPELVGKIIATTDQRTSVQVARSSSAQQRGLNGAMQGARARGTTG